MTKQAPVATRVALVGFGSVGQSLAKILVERPDLPLRLTGVADRAGAAIDPRGLDPRALLDAKSSGSVATMTSGRTGLAGADFLGAADAGVLVDAASTNFVDAEPGWSYVRAAVERGMDVVLASKGPLVLYWDELWQMVRERGVQLRYAGTTGAPLPVIELALGALPGSRLERLRALFNATSGVILDAMAEGAPFDDAVKRAQEAGLAETDPTLDVEGYDAAAKCVIVANSLMGADLRLQDVEREGITKLRAEDVRAAAEAGTPMKLVAEIWRDERARARVAPASVAPGDPLGTLRAGAMGIVFEAPPLGRLFTAVYDVGGVPTASAVLRDVLQLRPAG